MSYNVKLTKNGLTFNFPDEFIKQYESGPVGEIDKTIMPLGGPMANIGLDFNGVQKVITMSGSLFETSASVVSGVDSPTVTTAKQMKYWLESYVSGNQEAIEFYSVDDEYSLSNATGTTEIEGVEIPGTWVKTKVFVESPKITRVEGSPNMYSFSISFWVADA